MRLEKQTDLARVRQWIATFPGFDILGSFSCDYIDRIPACGGVFPAGLVEISRTEDILGNVTVQNQYNFGLYYVLEKAPGDDGGATENADWIMEFQRWVQAQSVQGRAPRFGNTGAREILRAQNGALYEAEDEGTATYLVALSVQFTKVYEVME